MERLGGPCRSRVAPDGQEAAAARAGVDQGLDGCQLSVALEEVELSREHPLGQLRTATLPLSSLHWLTSAGQLTPAQAPLLRVQRRDHRPNTGEEDWGSPRCEAVLRASRIEGTMNKARQHRRGCRTVARNGRLGSGGWPSSPVVLQRHPAPDGSWRAAIRRPHSRGGRATAAGEVLVHPTLARPAPPQHHYRTTTRSPSRATADTGNRPTPSRSHDRTDGVAQTRDGA